MSQSRCAFHAGGDVAAYASQIVRQLTLIFFPFALKHGILSGFHCLRHQTECHIFGQFNFYRRNKTVKDLLRRFRIKEQTSTLVRHDHKVERMGKADFRQSLKTSQGVRVVLEELSKLIPDKQNGFNLIFRDNILNPVCHALNIQTQSSNTVILCNGNDVSHCFGNLRRSSILQTVDNSINIVSAKRPRILLLGNKSVEIVTVCFLLQPFQSGITQGHFTTISDSMLFKCRHDTVLNSKNQILIRTNGARTNSVNGNEQTIIFVSNNLLTEILTQTIVIKVTFYFLVGSIQQ